MNPDNTFVAYRLAWIKAGLMAIGGALGAWCTAMDGVKWSELDGTEMTKVIFGCLGVSILVIVAFLDRTISKIEGERANTPGTPEHLVATGNKPPP